MKAREATLADKAATIELWQRCALTRPWNDPSRDNLAKLRFVKAGKLRRIN